MPHSEDLSEGPTSQTAKHSHCTGTAAVVSEMVTSSNKALNLFSHSPRLSGTKNTIEGNGHQIPTVNEILQRQ